MSTQATNRKPSLDIIRCLALLTVAGVHFFLHSDYYNTPIVGGKMYAFTLIRQFCMICVPLFIILSGYLMSKHTVSAKFYKKIIYILSIYFMASVCCTLFKVLYQNEQFNLIKFVQKILNFSAAPYSWYVEMYIGLFLLCPFLNSAYNNLKSKKEKTVLILTMLFLSALPHIVNIYRPDLQWFSNPTSSQSYVKLIPSYWTTLYPISYYFLGCYLKEFKLKIKPRNIFLLSVLTFFISGTFAYYRSYGAKFIRGSWQDHPSLLVVIQTVLLFAFFDNLNYEKAPAKLSRILAKLSSITFGAYLLSWIFDTAFYKILKQHAPTMPEQFNYFIIITLASYICSLAASYVLELIYSLISRLLLKIKSQK